MTETRDFRGSILVVDDTPASLGMLQLALDQENYQVFVAKSGEKALERVELINPDLILLDIMMPGLNGYETCQRLKSKDSTKDIPVIFLSALTKTFDKVKAFRIGAVDYITKPIEPEELLVRVNTHITIYKLKHELQTLNKDLEKRVEIRTAELQSAYSSLREREELFRSIFNGSPIGIELFNNEGKLVMHNPAIIEMFGLYDPGDIVGYDLFSESKINGDVIRQIKNGEFYHYEDMVNFDLVQTKNLYKTKKSGVLNYYALLTALHSFGDERITGYLLLIQDITELKKAIMQINNNILTFVALNDQIRNPLTIMAILADELDETIKAQFDQEIRSIDEIIDKLDRGYLESEKVRNYLINHYNMHLQ